MLLNQFSIIQIYLNTHGWDMNAMFWLQLKVNSNNLKGSSFCLMDTLQSLHFIASLLQYTCFHTQPVLYPTHIFRLGTYCKDEIVSTCDTEWCKTTVTKSI